MWGAQIHHICITLTEASTYFLVLAVEPASTSLTASYNVSLETLLKREKEKGY